MPHLNWRTSSHQQKVTPRTSGAADRDFAFELTLSVDKARELASALSEVLHAHESGTAVGELRLSLPNEWAIFWKQREDESRLLIAHPQENEWVATIALESSHAQALLHALLNKGAGTEISLTELSPDGGISSVSNLELVIKIS